MIKKILLIIGIVSFLFLLTIVGEPLWKRIDLFSKYTDPIPHVFILDQSYSVARLPMSNTDSIGDYIGDVSKKTLFTPNQNDESNFTKAGELYYINGEDSTEKIAIKLNSEYYICQKSRFH